MSIWTNLCSDINVDWVQVIGLNNLRLDTNYRDALNANHFVFSTSEVISRCLCRFMWARASYAIRLYTYEIFTFAL